MLIASRIGSARNTLGNSVAGRAACMGLLAAIAAFVCTSGTARGVQITITGEAGAQVDRGNGWEDAQTGMVLSTCNNIRLPGNFSWLTWQRVGGCGNTGRIETGLSKIKKYHVGTDLPSLGSETSILEGGFFDLLVGDGADGSDATIFESGDCSGNDHCGLNADFAAAAAIDPTPAGFQTIFSGCRQVLDGTSESAVFYNHPESPISIYVEIAANSQLVELPPGWWAQVAPSGDVRTEQGQPPVCGPEEPSPVSEKNWGQIKMLYR